MNKILWIGITWLAVIVTYISFAVFMPAVNEISTQAAIELQATSNMSNYPGTLEVVESSGWWMWAIPGIFGIIATVLIVKKKD
jgi:hypothetical protein